MNKPLLMLPLLLGLTVSGCAHMPAAGSEVSRGTTGMMALKATNQDQAILAEQTAALDQMMAEIVRNSTIKHAAVGAAVGCGIAVVSSGGASSCLGAAAAGGIAGAVTGHIAGNRDVARRIELVSANALVRSIRKSNNQLGDIKTDLPNLLARQDAELKSLHGLKAAGAINADVYNARLSDIRASRAELAEALMMSSQQARTASANLRAATEQGQSGLEWHISAVDQMEREALSARSSISLL